MRCIRNRAPFPQDYPALELTLTDDGDAPLAAPRPRAARLPRARPRDLRSGIAAGGEAPLRVYLDTSRTARHRLRLYLFYPS